MENLTKVEIKSTNIPNYYRLIVNIGDVMSNGYLISKSDLQNIKLSIDNIVKENI